MLSQYEDEPTNLRNLQRAFVSEIIAQQDDFKAVLSPKKGFELDFWVAGGSREIEHHIASSIAPDLSLVSDGITRRWLDHPSTEITWLVFNTLPLKALVELVHHVASDGSAGFETACRLLSNVINIRENDPTKTVLKCIGEFYSLLEQVSFEARTAKSLQYEVSTVIRHITLVKPLSKQYNTAVQRLGSLFDKGNLDSAHMTN